MGMGNTFITNEPHHSVRLWFSVFGKYSDPFCVTANATPEIIIRSYNMDYVRQSMIVMPVSRREELWNIHPQKQFRDDIIPCFVTFPGHNGTLQLAPSNRWQSLGNVHVSLDNQTSCLSSPTCILQLRIALSNLHIFCILAYLEIVSKSI
jgi:hypothetical protein